MIVKLLSVGLCALTVLAQAPRGTYRMRYSNMGNSDHLSRRGLFIVQDLAGVGSSQTVPNLLGSITASILGNDGGTDNDPIAQPGWMDFPDTGSWLTTDYNAADAPTSQLYIHFVARPSVQNANMTALAKWTGGGFNRSFLFYFGQDSANSKPACFVLQSNGNAGGYYVPDLDNTAGVWDAWACVASGTTITVFKNGRPSATSGGYDGTINPPNRLIFTGAIDPGVSYAWRGSIAHMQVGNVGVTRNQVWKDYTVLRRRMRLYGINLP